MLKDRPARVVAVVRNLYGHAFSSWAQLVKRHAYAEPFAHFVDTTYANPQLKALRVYAKVFGPENLRLIDYDHHRLDIVAPFLEAIGAPDLPQRRVQRINRSLSESELSLQLALNRVHHSSAVAGAVADALMARRPHPDRAPDRNGGRDQQPPLHRRSFPSWGIRYAEGARPTSAVAQQRART